MWWEFYFYLVVSNLRATLQNSIRNDDFKKTNNEWKSEGLLKYMCQNKRRLKSFISFR